LSPHGNNDATYISLEALLYSYGVRSTEYPGVERKFTERLALQFFVRDNLVRQHRNERSTYDKYLALASDLHLAGYQPNKTFEKNELKDDLRFAEDLLNQPNPRRAEE
jgi:hypothetical protein